MEGLHFDEKSIVGLGYAVECFIAAKLPNPKTSHGEDAKNLVKDYEAFLFACNLNMKDQNGNPPSDEEINSRFYKTLSFMLEKSGNKEALLKELGY